MAQGKPYQAYQNTKVQTSNQQQLIVMLYDGMDRFLTKAVAAIEEKDFEAAHNNLHRTGKILLELLSTLREDRGGEIAANLKRLYVYCYEEVVLANLKKDVAKIADVRQVLANLREGFQSARMGSQVQQGGSINKSLRITG